MVNWEAVAAVVEITGLVGVVVSLLFLAYQVRQNTLQLRQENILRTVRGTLDTNWLYHRDPEVFELFSKGCESFERLTPQEQAHFHSILIDLSFYLGVVMELRRSGLIDPSAVEINQRFFMGILRSPGGREWWEVVRDTKPMPQPVLDYFQSLLDNPEFDIPPITELQPWLARRD